MTQCSQRGGQDRRVQFVAASLPEAGREQPEGFPVSSAFQRRANPASLTFVRFRTLGGPMHTDHQHKIDPRLRKKKDETADAFIEVADSEAMDWLRRRPWVRGFVQIVDGYCSATLRSPSAHLDELAKHPGVVEVEAVRYVRLQLDQSVKSLHGWEAMPREKDRQRQGAG